MKVSICIGSYSATPYCFEDLGIRVFCMEELCYVLKENAFLLDAGIMTDKLLDWIGHKCGVTELAGELHPLVHQKGSLSSFVIMIMEYVGLYDTATISLVEQTLKRGSGLNVYEKRKMKMDSLLENKKYIAAIKGYQSLLSQWDSSEAEAGELKSKILHNKGVAHVGMMDYSKASKCFEKAYETDRNLDSYRCLLAAKRLELDESDYITYISDKVECKSHLNIDFMSVKTDMGSNVERKPLSTIESMSAEEDMGCKNENVEISLQLEQTMEKLNIEWTETEEYIMLTEYNALRQSGTKQKYYEENDRLIRKLRNDYRKDISE